MSEEAGQERGIKVHDLKTWPRYWQSVLDGTKPFDVRVDDRGFQVGDVVVLREWKPEDEYLDFNIPQDGAYTGRKLRAVVSYVFNLGPIISWEGNGVVVLGLVGVKVLRDEAQMAGQEQML